MRDGRDILFARAEERLDAHLPHGEGGRVGDGTAGWLKKIGGGVVVCLRQVRGLVRMRALARRV